MRALCDEGLHPHVRGEHPRYRGADGRPPQRPLVIPRTTPGMWGVVMIGMSLKVSCATRSTASQDGVRAFSCAPLAVARKIPLSRSRFRPNSRRGTTPNED